MYDSTATPTIVAAEVTEALAGLHRLYDCDGCGEKEATETLWLRAPLGLTAVHVHRVRECAEAARGKRGGGRFVTLGPGR